MKTTVGQNIKKLRMSFGLTQAQLSDRTGLSRGQIKNWETDRHEPDLQSLKVLASFFNTSTDALLSFESKKEDELLGLLFNDIQRAYEELDGRQQGRFAKQVALYVKMIQNNKDIL
ncbi:transcriptional regulator [Bacillus sp. AFS098217]|uniref:helix-turn-helix domain-containing protein n=1 Tax=unclassified Bacillus (in: firmicutes) TaxID=185979 RepID=UPI000BED8066|nr:MULTISPECIES: helix-turn-helix transcriptional regulator [unclassified Bacillus (in: firmicutes)]PEB52491.1 transcriptional regulator [Bacillus sp. AFS098217]PEU16791.1 transcriptional regulator [Bacillus sp. AFS019443]PFW58574.1 transcriptional regulator [Bacillus sp. AFS075034]